MSFFRGKRLHLEHVVESAQLRVPRALQTRLIDWRAAAYDCDGPVTAFRLMAEFAEMQADLNERYGPEDTVVLSEPCWVAMLDLLKSVNSWCDQHPEYQETTAAERAELIRAAEEALGEASSAKAARLARERKSAIVVDEKELREGKFITRKR